MAEPAESGPDRTESTRRALLKAAGASTAGGALATLFQTGAAATVEPTEGGKRNDVFDVEREGVAGTYPQSVASGGPTPSGVILWTRIDPDAYVADEPLGVEVARDAAFTDVVYRGVVDAGDVDPSNDYTVNVDLDGELAAGERYHYRFVYDGDASRVGRCRTLPAPDASPDEVSFAALSCNNYLHGYYGALAHVAEEDVDFLLHLGDFIYEYAGAGQQPGRDIDLPSGHDVAFGLDDFRHLHQSYRGDEFMQRALREHTLIHTWDDHEIVNNRWWNYDEDAPETESHPHGDDPAFMRELYVEGIKAYTEYVPARIEHPDAGLDTDRIQEDFRLYRSFQFGDLLDLFVTDERLYRSPPPSDAFGRRDTGTPPSEEAEDPDRSMLGTDQRRWLVDGVSTSTRTWKLWGNEVLNAALKTTNTGEQSFYLNYDAWDGYRYERQYLMGQFKDAGVENLVTLTGDMHTYVAAYLLEDYETLYQTMSLPEPENRVGVEFMTPAVTSDNLAAAAKLPPTLTEDVVDETVQTQNPHIEWFNSSRWGYSVVTVRPDECRYTAYGVDRTQNTADADRTHLRTYRVPAGKNVLERVDGTVTDRLIANVDGVDETASVPDGPDVFDGDDGRDGL